MAFDIHCMRGMMIVTAFGYATNSTLLMNEHLRHGLFGVSLNHPAYSNSFLISELLVWLSIQHKLFVGTDSFLLSNDGVKLLISNIVPMYVRIYHCGLF